MEFWPYIKCTTKDTYARYFYDITEERHMSMPVPDVFLCGEEPSRRQGFRPAHCPGRLQFDHDLGRLGPECVTMTESRFDRKLCAV